MTLENQCVSLELAKEMKELGLKQESLYYHCPHFTGSGSPYSPYEFRGDYYLRTWDKENQNVPVHFNDNDFYSAYTVAELGEMLPLDKIEIKKLDQSFYFKLLNEKGFTIYSEDAPTEADVRAMCLIYLKKNNLI